MSPSIAVQPSVAVKPPACIQSGVRLGSEGTPEGFLGCIRLKNRPIEPESSTETASQESARSLSRRLAAEAFIADRATQSRALARAGAMLRDADDARDVVAEANLALFSGKTEPRLYYRKLWQLCMDRLRRERRSRKIFVQRHDLGLHGEYGGDFSPSDPALSGGDPLEILIRREELAEGIQSVLGARHHKDLRRSKWWRELISHHIPQGVGGKASARAHM